MGAREKKCQISQELWNTAKILKISCARCHFVKFDIYFPGSHEKFNLVLLQITNYIYNPWKLSKKNTILFKSFWYKVFVYWILKLLNFLMDSFLKTFLKPTFKHLHLKPRSYLSVTFLADSPSALKFMYFCALCYRCCCSFVLSIT